MKPIAYACFDESGRVVGVFYPIEGVNILNRVETRSQGHSRRSHSADDPRLYFPRYREVPS